MYLNTSNIKQYLFHRACIANSSSDDQDSETRNPWQSVCSNPSHENQMRIRGRWLIAYSIRCEFSLDAVSSL